MSRGRGEHGFTLPELLIAVAILAIIIAPLTMSMVTALRVVGRADQKFTDSRSALLSAAYFANDVASANTITKGGAACGGGTALVTFGWVDSTTVSPLNPLTPLANNRTISYVVDSSDPQNVRLRRQYCESGALTSQSSAAVSLDPATTPDVTCDTGSACAGVPRWVKLTVTQARNLPTPAQPSPAKFVFTLEGSRRSA